jgi:hypothetical protein
MREVISVHVGQAGVQIGNACCKYALSARIRVFFVSRRDTIRRNAFRFSEHALYYPL